MPLEVAIALLSFQPEIAGPSLLLWARNYLKILNVHFSHFEILHWCRITITIVHKICKGQQHAYLVVF